MLSFSIMQSLYRTHTVTTASTNNRAFIDCLSVALAVVLITVMPSLHADDIHYDLFELDATVVGDVENDLLEAQLVVEAEDRDPARLANRVNADMQWALAELKKYPELTARTMNYSTWPRYEHKQNRIIGWHASQQLQIEATDFDVAGKAIQVLQEKLVIRQMNLLPSPETRAGREDELISDALRRFAERAAVIQRTMGAAGYRVLDVTVNASGGHAMPGPRAYAAERSQSVDMAPAIEPGSSEVRVTVRGRIELQ